MAGRLSTAPDNGGNRPRPEVAQAEEIFQDLGAFGFEGSEIVRHREFLSVRIYPLRNMAQKKKIR